MATKGKNKNAKAAPEEQIQGALNQTESFLQKNGKTLLTVLIVLLIIVGGYFAYKYLYSIPKQERVAEQMFVAEQLFGEGNFETALEGDGSNPGFREIADNYSSTQHGRLAAHYAGICLMREGNYEEALKYLEKYKPTKGSPNAIINAQNLGLRGDIYVLNTNYATAVTMYKQAVDAADNILTTPYMLRKLALAYEQTGEIQKAIETCKRIRTDFADSVEARDIDKYLGYLEQL